MKILLVEDNPDDLILARRELGRLGYALVSANDAESALSVFDLEQPDVVITDIRMPGIDGIELTRLLHLRAAPRWQPVLLLSGHRDEEIETRALQVGAEALIVKPVSAALLDARLRSIDRLLQLQRAAEERARSLERYHAAEEDEKRIARHLIERMVSAPKLADPALTRWIESANGFSGDVIAAARTPANVLHVMLADGTGHGLAASINVLPITPPFYSMTDKGFAIDSIARELNAKVRQLLPRDRFVAATLAAIDFREGLIHLWNGGNPGPFLLDATGVVIHEFSQAHLPLGVASEPEFDAHLESVAVVDEAQLVMFSDGLLEAQGQDWISRGVDRMRAAMAGVPASGRLASVQKLVGEQLDGEVAHDDISLVLVDCRHDVMPEPAPRLSAGTSSRSNGWSFSLCLGVSELRRLDVVPILLGLVHQFEDSLQRTGELFLVLSEFFNNALDHGLLRLDSKLKLGPDGLSNYLAHRSLRLAALADGEIQIEVARTVNDQGDGLQIRCRDTGPGFNHQGFFRQPAFEGDAPFGRGLDLVARLCSSIEFNAEGNFVTAVLPLNPPPDHAADGLGNYGAMNEPARID